MDPGYYVVVRDAVLANPTGPQRIKIHRGDWLITDGRALGRFDKTAEFDWVPLEWARGHGVEVSPELLPTLDRVLIPTTPQKLEAGFHRLMFVEPGEPLPDLPRPALNQLEPYLRSRRGLVAASFTYDRRS